LRFIWLGTRPELSLSRVYALAFDADGRMLLVGDETGRYWLPGGAVEAGESVDQALARELKEEANATILAHEPIGVQRAEAEGRPPEHHGFHAARIELADEFRPEHEITRRILVEPEEFLDTLFWGRTDPKAPILLERARASRVRRST